MEAVTTTLTLIIAVIAGLLVTFFKGKSSGKEQAKAQQNEEKLAELEQVGVTREKVKESDNAANSKDRDALIDDIIADSVRNHEGRDRQ